MGRDPQERFENPATSLRVGCGAPGAVFAGVTYLRSDLSCMRNLIYAYRVRGAPLIREARLRAGLTQDELSAITGHQRSVIARWEQGAVSPSFDNLLEVIEACGLELPLILIPRDTTLDARLDKNRLLTPERRARRLFTKLEKEAAGDG